MFDSLGDDLSRTSLKPIRPRLHFVSVEEHRQLLRRVGVRPITDHRGTTVTLDKKEATHDAELTQLITTTGIRVLELSRVMLSDVTSTEIYIRTPKDRSNPRSIPLGNDFPPILDRLCHRTRRHAIPDHGDPPGESSALANQRRVSSMAEDPLRASPQWPNSSSLACDRDHYTVGTSFDAMKAAGHRNPTTTDRFARALSPRAGEVRSRLASAFGLDGVTGGGSLDLVEEPGRYSLGSTGLIAALWKRAILRDWIPRSSPVLPKRMKPHLALMMLALLLDTVRAQFTLTVGPVGDGQTCGPCLHPMDTPRLQFLGGLQGTSPETLAFSLVTSGQFTSTVGCFSLPTSPVPIPDLGSSGWHLPTGCLFHSSAPFAFLPMPQAYSVPVVGPFDCIIQGVGLSANPFNTCIPPLPFVFVTNAIALRIV